MRLFEFFERTYIINLPERTDRLREIKEEFARLGVELTPGKIEIFPASKVEDAGMFVSRGLHGCFLSHLAVLKHAMKEGLKNVLVIEDDLAMSDRLPLDEARLVESLQSREWSIVYLGNLLHPLGNAPIFFLDCSIPLIGAHFYGVQGSVLPALVEFFEPIETRPAGHPDGSGVSPDGVLNMFRERHPELKTLIALPNLGHQRSTRSDISPKWFDRVPGLRQLANLARYAKRRLKRKRSR